MQKLPAIKDLYKLSPELNKSNQLNVLLNQEPNPKWILIHPMAKGARYIPIEIIEFLLTSIFVKWKVEIKKSEVMANSVIVTIRLHYLDPVTQEWEWQDGIGAAPIQTDKGASATDFSKVKNDALMKAAPAAESFAIKDAAEKLGKLFGKDLNRKNGIPYGGLAEKDLGDDSWKKEIDEIKTIEELAEYQAKNTGKGKEFDAYIIKRKSELEKTNKS